MWDEVDEIQPPSKSAKEAGYNRILKYKRIGGVWDCGTAAIKQRKRVRRKYYRNVLY